MKKALKGMKLSLGKLIKKNRQDSEQGVDGLLGSPYGQFVPKYIVPVPSIKLARRKQIALELQKVRSRAG